MMMDPSWLVRRPQLIKYTIPSRKPSALKHLCGFAAAAERRFELRRTAKMLVASTSKLTLEAVSRITNASSVRSVARRRPSRQTREQDAFSIHLLGCGSSRDRSLHTLAPSTRSTVQRRAKVCADAEPSASRTPCCSIALKKPFQSNIIINRVVTDPGHRHTQRRCFATTSSCTSQSTNAPDPSAKDLSEGIRSLMRSIAQPVALITTFLAPQDAPSSTNTDVTSCSSSTSTKYWLHAATLSSLTTISIHPPLVSFSIRSPSKVCNSLEYYGSTSATEGDNGRGGGRGHFVINFLTMQQQGLAEAYARPGTPAYLYHDGDATSILAVQKEREQEHVLDDHPLTEPVEETGMDGEEVPRPPRLLHSVGSFECQIVESIALNKYLCTQEQQNQGQNGEQGDGSVLYIARIVRAWENTPESIGTAPESSDHQQPLLYHRQKFVTPASPSHIRETQS